MARYRGRHAAARAAAGSPAPGGLRQHGTGRRFRRRTLRRRAASAVVAALAMAALTASQAPGADFTTRSGVEGGPRGYGQPGDDSYHTELPPLESPAPSQRSGPPPRDKGDAGIPRTLLTAYKRAAASLRESNPGCGLRWELLAAIGKVESSQARDGAVDPRGTTLRPILGPVLNGKQFAKVKDTDDGRLDGDSSHDKALGPMQFIPSTWSRWSADGNRDGREDPQNVFDAALAAGSYLCADGRDLASSKGLERAILSYNHSRDYLRTVLAWYEFYRKGTHKVPDGRGAPAGTPGQGGRDEPAKRVEGKPDGGGPASRKPSKQSAKAPSKTPSKSPSKAGSKTPTKKPPERGGSPERPGDGGGSKSPTPTPTPTSGANTPASVEREGDAEISATAGGEFTDRLRVRVENKAGKALRDIRVRYEIRGRTGARFTGDKPSVITQTDTEGVATAPKLHAGDEPSLFTVRATVEGRDLRPAEFTGTVKPRPPMADRLTRTDGSEKALEAKPDDRFADPVEIKATYKGKPVPHLPVVARIPVGNDKGPYFKDPGKQGHKLRTLTLKTNSRGTLRLPHLFTDSASGAFSLQLTARPTPATLTIPLKVTPTP